ncbi:putative WD repeat-containing protein [Diplonema papillatum]|nr:putative WD repeat-containing protein [Diplonema papillatum]|eukprot:gene23171-35506_t
MADQAIIPTDPESDCLMAYSGPGLDAVFALEVTSTMFLIGSHDGLIRGFHLDNPNTACEFASHQGTVRELIASPDEKHLYSCSVDGTVKTWNLADGLEMESRSIPQSKAALDCLHVAGSHIIAGGVDGAITVWDTNATGSPESPQQSQTSRITDFGLRLRVHAGGISSVQAHRPSGSQLSLFTTSNDGLAKYIDVGTGKLLAVYEGCGALFCSAFDEEKSLLYVGGSASSVLMFDIRSAGSVGQLRGHREAITGMALAPPLPADAMPPPETANTLGVMHAAPRKSNAGPPPGPPSLLYTASDDCTVTRWNPDAQTRDYVFQGHVGGVSCIKLAVSKPQLVTGSYDATVRLWDVFGAEQKVARAAQQKAKEKLAGKDTPHDAKRQKKKEKKGSSKKKNNGSSKKKASSKKGSAKKGRSPKKAKGKASPKKNKKPTPKKKKK